MAQILSVKTNFYHVWCFTDVSYSYYLDQHLSKFYYEQHSMEARNFKSQIMLWQCTKKQTDENKAAEFIQGMETFFPKENLGRWPPILAEFWV